MNGEQVQHIVVVGAGAAGLMAARELARAGRRVTILEAQDRCGGRILPLSAEEFGYAAEGGAEFIHGEAPVTHGLLREAGLSILPMKGARWRIDEGRLAQNDLPQPEVGRLQDCLSQLKADMTVTAFLKQYFAGPEYSGLRQFFVRMVEGYDAADPDRASIMAIRDEWMSSGRSKSSRIVGGYAALIRFLEAECMRLGVTIHLRAIVTAVETIDRRTAVRCADGDTHIGGVAILTVPLALLSQLVLSPSVREMAANVSEIGFGNVIKLLLRFKSRWWINGRGEDLSDLLFLRSSGTVPVWWTQHPAEHPVLTGWLAGPRSKRMAYLEEKELVKAGVISLADAFGLSPEQVAGELVAARAIDWSRDPFARGAYSYATPETRLLRSTLKTVGADPVLFSGEAFYPGADMGTVEAALASGRDTARTALTGNRAET